MIVEFQTRNDMIAEAEADVSMGLQVARSRARAAADVKPGDQTKLAREINFIGRSASQVGECRRHRCAVVPKPTVITSLSGGASERLWT